MAILRLSIGLFIAFTLLSIQPVNAVQDQPEIWLKRFAPERCTLFVHWSGISELKSEGNPTEQWLAQPEIQLALKKLSKAIRGYQELHPINDAPMQELLLKVPTLLKDCSASVYFGIDNVELGPDSSPSMGGIVALGKHEPWAQEFLKTVANSGRDKGVVERVVDGHQFYAANLDKPEEALHFGIMDGHLIFTFGVDAFQQSIANLKSPAPEWLSQAQKETAIDRTLGYFYFNPDDLFKMSEQMGRAVGIPKSLRLKDVKSISGSIGLDEEGFVASMFLACPEATEGVTAVLSRETIDKSLVSEVPGGEMSAAGARISFSAVSDLIQSAASELGDDSVEEVVLDIEELTSLDWESEIIPSFDDYVFSYQSLSPLTMGTTGVIAMKVKDPKSFAELLTRFNQEISQEVEALDLGEFIEKESNGQLIYTLNRPLYNGPSFSWCHVEDFLYVSGDAKSISTHLRKRKRTRNRLIDNPRFEKSFSYGQSRGWGNPVAFSHVDVATILEMVVPLGMTFLAGQQIPDFDFTIDDLPPVDILTRGVKANVITVFRSPQGIHLVERSTLPGGSTVATSGVAIGMLLPAVQQVRNAARRATTLNNMRQIQLALLNYESAHGSFPPAFTTDENGKPLLSWRVAILPYLEAQSLYDEFRQDEPWDSEHNQALVAKMPEAFENPSAMVGAGETTFLGAGGQDGVFSGEKANTLASIVDGTSMTISVLDVNSQNAVPWSAPRDLDPDGVDDLTALARGNWPGSLVLIALADGSCHAVSDLTHEELVQLLNRKDGKSVDLYER